MNTEAIRAYAHAMYAKNPEDMDAWHRFDDNWEINIFYDGMKTRVFVYPVIDQQVQTKNSSIYSFVMGD